MRYLYSALLYFLLPFILLRMLLRSRKAPAYRRRWGERLGFLSTPAGFADSPVIWVHAVSVGETLAAVPVIEQLLQDRPDHQIVVTTTTPTGSDRVKAQFGDRVLHVYGPWDLPGAVKRFLKLTQPRLVVIMETELWPNLLHYSKASGARILLANARLSERSARGYGRFAALTAVMLQQLDAVACQSEADGQRLLNLGLPESALHITGSIKFDLELNQELKSQASNLQGELRSAQRPVLVAASTQPGEDEEILSAFSEVRAVYPDCLLLLVPRHPERFDAVYRLARDAQWQVQRRSCGNTVGPEHDILLGDTMGELRLLLSAATVAIIGGSLVEHGGQNLLEAAAWGVPVVCGPHMFNFAEISQLMLEAGGMVQLDDSAELSDCLLELLSDPARCEQMGAAGLQVVQNNRGARQRLMVLVEEQLSGA